MTDTRPLGDLTGRRILITGASRGIGRGIAIACAEAGADVAVNFRSHPEEADDVVAEIEQLGRKAIAVQADVADREAVRNLFEQSEHDLGPLDGVVSNAAYSDRKRLLDLDLELFDRTLDVSMGGAFNLLHAAAKTWVIRSTWKARLLRSPSRSNRNPIETTSERSFGAALSFWGDDRGAAGQDSLC